MVRLPPLGLEAMAQRLRSSSKGSSLSAAQRAILKPQEARLREVKLKCRGSGDSLEDLLSSKRTDFDEEAGLDRK